MPSITFTQTRVVNDQFKGTDKETRFEAGQTYRLPSASCVRWKSRGVAFDAAADITSDPDPAPVPVEIPEAWRDLKWPALKALAAGFTTAAINKKEEAIDEIEAELFRREPISIVAFQQRTRPDGVKSVYVDRAWPTKVEITPALFEQAPDHFTFDAEAKTVTIDMANGRAVYRMVEETVYGTAILGLLEGNYEPAPAE
ncbi:hypothetical protein [Aminobacter aminovorans]|uniref:Uncharacterized protein n=1 Tax=Aminobacter aminovorans TaxID=83263 RepID=A0AAC8YMP6_AMIAI|nr:hypothetical protein [Aminobacter aminovorans]AMS41167.1 hypothetical protein AA2016_2238 [Aminobacter aminovorans]MBB3705851.1 hypothetical protein [Aminobacter aminovorans]